MLRFTLAVALWLPVICCAQLAGDFQFNFTNHPSLWDFSGTYPISSDTLQVGTTLSHLPTGLVTGTGIAHFDDGSVRFNANEIAAGRVFNVGKSNVHISVKGAGQFTGTYSGLAIAGPFTSVIELGLNATDRTLAGTETGTLCVAGRGCRTLSTNVIFQLPTEMDGTWSFTLDVTTTNRTVRGTATAQLSNGRALPFNVRGTYSRI